MWSWINHHQKTVFSSACNHSLTKSNFLVARSQLGLNCLYTLGHGGRGPGNRVCHVEIRQDLLRHIDWIFRQGQLLLQGCQFCGLCKKVGLFHQTIAGQIGSNLIQAASNVLNGVVWQCLANDLNKEKLAYFDVMAAKVGIVKRGGKVGRKIHWVEKSWAGRLAKFLLSLARQLFYDRIVLGAKWTAVFVNVFC